MTEKNSSLLPEGLPSFEEVTRSMQDLAERDDDAWPSLIVSQPPLSQSTKMPEISSTVAPQPPCPPGAPPSVPQPLCSPPSVAQPGPPTVGQPGVQATSSTASKPRGEPLVRQPGSQKTAGNTAHTHT